MRSRRAAELLDLATAVLADSEGAPELLLDAPDAGRNRMAGLGRSGSRHSGWPRRIRPDRRPGPRRIAADAGLDLSGGAWAEIEALRALVAIDVNTGSDHSPAAGLKANIALARDLSRQLRLRGLGGQIVVDFAPMPKRDRGTLDQILRSAFRSEAAETVLIGWTTMGLYEINRKRDRIALSRLARQETV
jgi:ribonuclease G